jgi:hypothetical protein
MTDTVKSDHVQNLFIKGVHHRGISVILLNQNLLPQGKCGRDIRLNTHYVIIMKSPTLRSQVTFLGRQLFSERSKFLIDAYKKATETSYSYLFVNLHPHCHESELIFVPK